MLSIGRATNSDPAFPHGIEVLVEVPPDTISVVLDGRPGLIESDAVLFAAVSAGSKGHLVVTRPQGTIDARVPTS